MIYCNMLWEAFELDLEKLRDIPIWYADYEPVPQTPYSFLFWQYTNCGKVDGIKGEVDIDIWMRRVEQELICSGDELWDSANIMEHN